MAFGAAPDAFDALLQGGAGAEGALAADLDFDAGLTAGEMPPELPGSPSNQAARLREEATKRWLTKHEIVAILTDPAAQGMAPETQLPALPPPSGSLLLYSGPLMSKFRRDHHQWVLKQNATGVREDRTKLKLDGVARVYACHAHSAAVPTFHRRSYRLIPREDAACVLVHYLDEVYTAEEQLRRQQDAALWAGLDSMIDEAMTSVSMPAPPPAMPPPPAAVSVTDLAPEVAPSATPTKLLVCLSGALAPPLALQFGRAPPVAAEQVAPGVLRCMTPTGLVGTVPVVVVSGATGQALTLPGAQIRFEGEPAVGTKRVRQRGGGGAPPPPSPARAGPGGDAFLDDEQVERLGDGELSEESERVLMGFLRQLVSLADDADELREELNAPDDQGLTMLHYAAVYDMQALVPMLVTRGADLDAQTVEGYTPLHVAAEAGHAGVAAQLLQHGASADVLDGEGQTAADRAVANGHPEMARLWPHSQGSSPGRSPAGAGASGSAAGSPASEPGHSRGRLLSDAFAAMSLHDKCAIQLGRSPAAAAAAAAAPASPEPAEASPAAASEERRPELEAAISLMAPDERSRLNDEASKVQANFRAWVLQRNYRRLREASVRAQAKLRGLLARREFQQTKDATLTLQAQYRGFTARRDFQQTKDATVTLQALARGMQARKQFREVKRQALAGLVIQRYALEALRRSGGSAGSAGSSSGASGGGSSGGGSSGGGSSGSGAEPGVVDMDTL